MIPGVAALMLARGCPEERLDECFQLMGEWPTATTCGQAVRDVDLAISLLPPDAGD
jgi:hypothetical protein